MQMQYICQMNCLHWLDIKGCSYAESKKLRKDKVNPAELAASKPLASEQASEDVVGGANTPFGGATRDLGARRGASNFEGINSAAFAATPRVSPRAKERA